MSAGRFWSTAAAVSVLLALGARWLFPYDLLGIEDLQDRHRTWLLTLWTGGVMAICFGGSGLIGTFSPLGFRDVADAGSVRAAIEMRERARRERAGGFYNFAGWLVALGGCLILLYFVGWSIGLP